MNRWTLEQKRAVVTGGTKGIGRAIVEELLGFGADVLLVARHSGEVEQVVQELSNREGTVHGMVADVSIQQDREALIGRVHELWGGLDLLINNAGTNIRKSSDEYNEEEYDQIFDTNTRAVFELCRLSHAMLRASGGSIVNVGSVAGLRVTTTGAPYAMSKAAVAQLTRYLAVEWAKDGIRVNTVAPWYIETPLAASVLADPDYRSRVHGVTPMGRTGTVEEVAAAVVFLCLPAASYITGQCLAVDGGFLQLGFDPR